MANEGRDVNLIAVFGTDTLDLQEIDKITLKGFSISDFDNSKVREFVQIYQTSGRNVLSAILSRADVYVPMILDVFREHGIPDDLAYLPIIESGFRPKAVSPAGATGVWQFMYGTGRMYGLDNDYWHEDRSDIFRSTHAAARHLKYLYKRFDNWLLAIAAYNAGCGKIGKAIEMYDTADFWNLCRYPYLKKETKDYVPKFIAAAMIAKNPGHYGFDRIQSDKFQNVAAVGVTDAFEKNLLAQGCGLTISEFDILNPALKQWATPPGKTYTIYLPSSAKDAFLSNIATIPEEKRVTFRRYMARSGDNLSHIARKFGVPVNPIVALNKNIRSRHSIEAGEFYFIPIKGLENARKADVQFSAADKNFRSETGSGYLFLHEVSRWDTLYSISRMYNVDIADIYKWNGLVSKFSIRPGRFLIIQIPAEETFCSLTAK